MVCESYLLEGVFILNTITTKLFRSIKEQVQLLIERGLIIEDEALAEKMLLERNYFDLINGFESLLLKDYKATDKKYENKYFSDFISLYDFDKILSSKVMSVISTFEIRLKTSIAYHFCEKYCLNEEDAMRYIDMSYYNYNRQDTNDLSRFFHSHDLFKIDDKGRNFIDRVKYKYAYTNKYMMPPFWVTIKVFTLHELLIIFYNLDKDVLNEVLKDFNLTPADKALFVNSIEIIKFMRNHCAHFELVNRFRTPGSTKINNTLINQLQLNCMSSNFQIRFFDSLKVLKKYQDIGEVIDEIVGYWDKNVEQKKEYINQELFKRMGQESIEKRKKLK